MVDPKDSETLGDILQKERSTLLLVKFGAAWCAPCVSIQPTLEKIADEWEGDVEVYDFDVEADPVTADKWRVRTVPTLVLIDEKGEELGRLIGLSTHKQIESLLSEQFDDSFLSKGGE